MTIIEKLERALAMAKELEMNDDQVKNMIAIVLGVTIQQSPLHTPFPWVQPSPFAPKDTIISIPPNTTIPPWTITWGGTAHLENPSGIWSFNVNLKPNNPYTTCGLFGFGSANPVVSC